MTPTKITTKKENMGVSITILEKQKLILSIEIDRDITLEMGSGFQDSKAENFISVGMKLSISDIDEVIENLQSVKEELKNSWMCQECKTINAPKSPDCQVCSVERIKS